MFRLGYFLPETANFQCISFIVAVFFVFSHPETRRILSETSNAEQTQSNDLSLFFSMRSRNELGARSIFSALLFACRSLLTFAPERSPVPSQKVVKEGTYNKICGKRTIWKGHHLKLGCFQYFQHPCENSTPRRKPK